MVLNAILLQRCIDARQGLQMIVLVKIEQDVAIVQILHNLGGL
jgi:hypothetical protein